MTETIEAVVLAAELTAAWLANPNTRTSAEDVPAFLTSMHQAVIGLTTAGSDEERVPEVPSYEAAVSVRKSLASPDHIISMIDGKSYKPLRRHLSTYGLTPEQYRERYKLKADYPIVAASCSEARRAMAKPSASGASPAPKSRRRVTLPRPRRVSLASRQPLPAKADRLRGKRGWW